MINIDTLPTSDHPLNIGMLSRKAAEDQLHSIGSGWGNSCWLLRESPNASGSFILSEINNTQISHSVIPSQTLLKNCLVNGKSLDKNNNIIVKTLSKLDPTRLIKESSYIPVNPQTP